MKLRFLFSLLPILTFALQHASAELSFEEGANAHLRGATKGDMPGVAVLVAVFGARTLLGIGSPDD